MPAMVPGANARFTCPYWFHSLAYLRFTRE
jgi:hypothetical protein